MTAKSITDALAQTMWRPRQQVLVPNVSWGLGIWEADLLVLYNSNYLEEVEVKISRADFRKEFKKKLDKHEQLVKGVPDLQWPQIEDHDFDWDKWEKEKPVKHWNAPKPTLIRKFWFAMPLELARSVESEVPAHAGLIGIVDRGTRWHRYEAHVLKIAPKLVNARKLTEQERGKLLRLAYLRYWDIRGQEQEAA